jgi:hypothetical protein
MSIQTAEVLLSGEDDRNDLNEGMNIVRRQDNMFDLEVFSSIAAEVIKRAETHARVHPSSAETTKTDATKLGILLEIMQRRKVLEFKRSLWSEAA